ncbi:biotin/lipoyl-binding carrier protein [Ferruginivarius sediminum]|uniref:Biotin/lipoyl-binding protein n=1 Tax=Ferruginivarius sediminum TaxID=2661937 RepID=A0A369TAJ5_9PROT|nr:biotin/lipoyl-binding carrier protein [Ferruginivarius sediminum]RDD62351.1 biotin/lipoyl-binding protein [Ferruginivarius sediminum]
MTKQDVTSTVTGTVWKVETAKGDRIAEGDPILIIESMKMEIPVMAPVAGVVSEILVAVDDMVDEGQILAVIEA